MKWQNHEGERRFQWALTVFFRCLLATMPIAANGQSSATPFSDFQSWDKSSAVDFVYVEVVQLDLQREFHRAREKTASLYSIPQLPVLSATAPARVDLATIRQAIVATHRALQLLQPQLEDKNRQKLRRLAQGLLNVDHELDHLTSK
jgi:hypothetical protein